MSFFDERPATPEPVTEPEWTQPAWLSAPRDELGIPVVRPQFLARGESASLALLRIDAFSNGVLFALRLDTRVSAGAAEGERVNVRALFAPGSHHDPATEQRFGVALSDGTRAETDPEYWRHANDDTIVGPRLTPGGGSGGGSDGQSWTQTFDLWLWPLPPEGPLTLHWLIGVPGIGEGHLELDTAPILKAAAQTLTVWAD